MYSHKFSHFQYLHDKWSKRHEDSLKNLWKKHKHALSWIAQNTKHAAFGSLSGVLLLAAPLAHTIPSPQTLFADKSKEEIPLDRRVFAISDLAKVVPPDVRELTPQEEERIGQILSRDYKIKVAAELDGKRLNRSYGLIGAEQHLARYPGDTMYSHFDNEEDVHRYTSSGMAPGLGAWGYFAPSREAMTKEDALMEKYYIAVQTFLAPDFISHVAEYRDFFKFRKMLVVNPQNGKAVVAVIGDAGPGVTTGKHLGGSPEVMKHLERVDGKARGAVLYFFIDDPENSVPLGPVTI